MAKISSHPISTFLSMEILKKKVTQEKKMGWTNVGLSSSLQGIH